MDIIAVDNLQMKLNGLHKTLAMAVDIFSEESAMDEPTHNSYFCKMFNEDFVPVLYMVDDALAEIIENLRRIIST